jgi:hypothetical protein
MCWSTWFSIRDSNFVGDAFFLGPFIDRQVDVERALQFILEASDIPLLGIGMLGHVLGDDVLDEGVAHVGDRLGNAVVLHQVDALVEDHLALVVLDVVNSAGSCGCRSCAPRPSAAPFQRLVDPGMNGSPFEAKRVSSIEPVEPVRIRSSSSDRKNFERPGSP